MVSRSQTWASQMLSKHWITEPHSPPLPVLFFILVTVGSQERSLSVRQFHVIRYHLHRDDVQSALWQDLEHSGRCVSTAK